MGGQYVPLERLEYMLYGMALVMVPGGIVPTSEPAFGSAPLTTYTPEKNVE